MLLVNNISWAYLSVTGLNSTIIHDTDGDTVSWKCGQECNLPCHNYQLYVLVVTVLETNAVTSSCIGSNCMGDCFLNGLCVDGAMSSAVAVSQMLKVQQALEPIRVCFVYRLRYHWPA